MSPLNNHRLDFDYLTDLARSNPSEFERLRLKAIEGYLSSLPRERQQRMRRLQWRIDQVRRKHTPMGDCIRLSNMMWDHLLGADGLAGPLQGEDSATVTRSAKVIDFPRDPGS